MKFSTFDISSKVKFKFVKSDFLISMNFKVLYTPHADEISSDLPVKKTCYKSINDNKPEHSPGQGRVSISETYDAVQLEARHRIRAETARDQLVQNYQSSPEQSAMAEGR